MKIQYKNTKREEETIDVKSINIKLNDDVEYRININKFGELELTKQNFGDGDGSITIKPSVSNQIRLM